MVKTGSQANSSCNLSTITCTYSTPTIICSHNVPKCIQTRLISVNLYPLVWVPGPLTMCFCELGTKWSWTLLVRMYQESIYRYELISLILCTSLEKFQQTMSKEHLRSKYYLRNSCIMYLVSFVCYWNDPICIKVSAPKLFWILQGYVGMGGCLTLRMPTRVSFKDFVMEVKVTVIQKII